MKIGTIGDFFNIKGGKRLPKGCGFSTEKTKYPYIRVTDFKRNSLNTSNIKYINENIQKRISQYTIDSNSVYLSIAGTIGIAGIIPNEFNGANLTENAAKITPKDYIEVDTKYLSYLLNSKKVQSIIKSKTMAVGVPKLALFRIKEIPVTLPPLSTQQMIAKFLDQADILRNKTQQVIDLYDQLAQSIFLDMFGDPVRNSKGWEIKEVIEIGRLISGGTPSRQSPEYFNGTIPWITTVALRKRIINQNDAQEFITNKAIENSATKLIPKGSIMIGTRVGVGKASIIDCDMCSNQDILSLINISRDYNVNFLLASFRFFEMHFNNQKRGATIQGITSDTIKQLGIIIPPITLQNQFAEKISLIEKQKELAKQSLQESENLFNALLQKAFKGELVNSV